jgi:hypothetical protein
VFAPPTPPDHHQNGALKMADDRLTDEHMKHFLSSMVEEIQRSVECVLWNMANDKEPEAINRSLLHIAHQISLTNQWRWPDPMLKLLEAARRDKGVQKLIKNVSRKTPI